jgi:5'-methylthioadenosine phosphorylase
MRSSRNSIKLAVIGGSQAYSLLESKQIKGKRISPKQTPFGKSQPVFELDMGGKGVLFMSRHGEKSYSLTAPFVNYRANIYALKDLGATHVIAWTGPGAISTRFAPGDFVILSDIIDETRGRRGTFFENKGYGFIRMAEPFCASLRGQLLSALRGLKVRYFAKGVYVCTEGPRLETPAEIKKHAQEGAELVGMTIAPEVFLARELEICYAAIAYVTNYAEGVKSRKHKPGKLFEGLATASEMKAIERAVQKFPKIIQAMAEKLDEMPRVCHCRSAMQRYKAAGHLPADWRKWFK